LVTVAIGGGFGLGLVGRLGERLVRLVGWVSVEATADLSVQVTTTIGSSGYSPNSQKSL